MSVVVASVPAGHVYVRHLAHPEGDGVVRLPDPPPSSPAPAEQWWPPRMLEPGWVDENAEAFDVMHVHFGFDAVDPEALTAVAESLRRHGKPLVLTVHDLRNPHHPERGLHDAQLGVLVEAATRILTLTPGAAREIAARWGRVAQVLPHPHVVEDAWLRRPRPAHDGLVVGIHCKSLRASMDPLPVVEQAARTLADLPGARLRVDAHTDVMTPGFSRHEARLADRLRELEADGRIELHVHDYFTDDELFGYLQSLDVSVLPYRFGTHSGWLEACHDLGTTVVAPDCGFYADQRPLLGYTAGDDASLDAALRTAYADRPAWRARPADRLEERRSVARAHEALYRAALAEVAACAS